MTFDEWLNEQQKYLTEMTLCRSEDVLPLLLLVRAQREYIHRLRTADEGFHEGHMAQIASHIARLEAVLMGERQ